jgi:hypothetical protein
MPKTPTKGYVAAEDYEVITLHTGSGLGVVRIPPELSADGVLAVASQLHLIAQLLEARASSMTGPIDVEFEDLGGNCSDASCETCKAGEPCC